jgi:hypothetical protein
MAKHLRHGEAVEGVQVEDVGDNRGVRRCWRWREKPIADAEKA